MSRYDAWLESGAHDHEDEEIWVEEEMSNILEDAKPASLPSFCEAVGEDCLYKRREQIEQALEKRDFTELGRLVWACNIDYWEEYAENLAQERWASGYRD